MEVHSYSKIYAVGHPAVAELLTGDVIVEEKIDGSQFSMTRDASGELHIRSRGVVMTTDAPEKMFTEAAEVAKSLDLTPGWTYRCEYLKSPRHNTLQYSRIPAKHLIVFDIERGLYDFLRPDQKHVEAARLGLEVVPVLRPAGKITMDSMMELLETQSVLGGEKIEGVVLKPVRYDLYGTDKKVLMAKFVSERFKERHGKQWSKSNPNKSDVIQLLTAKYGSEAVWVKAVHRLRDEGKLESSPRDIASLIKDVQADVTEEWEAEIKEWLFKWAMPQIQRGVVRGLPEWYKERIAREQLESA